ncbi:hypothetical protein ACIP5Y_37370 [Nocardia sp. NPDC088792]|uniref:hypothetical protein n=1 Tax=Nocardia sp. NPDC088792 TaxID=3364332 RepID=UPI0038274C2E
MPDADKKRAAHQALVDRILTGKGRTSPEQRKSAFHNADVPESLRPLIGKVVAKPQEVTAADFGAAQAAGCSEDEIFELVVATAVGRSTRLYEAGLTALAEASGSAEAG